MIDRTSGLAPSNCAGAQQLRGAGLLGHTTLVDLARNVKPGARWLALLSRVALRSPGWLGRKGVAAGAVGEGPQTPALARPGARAAPKRGLRAPLPTSEGVSA
jgi:hypothetical protein